MSHTSEVGGATRHEAEPNDAARNAALTRHPHEALLTARPGRCSIVSRAFTARHATASRWRLFR